MYHAAREGWLSALKWLIASGADAHLGAPHYGWAPLHAAAVEDHHEAVLLLLDAGGRVNAPGGHGITILHYCATNGLSRMCELLMSRGASLDALSDIGEDPEARARRYDRTATADVLAAVRAAGGWPAYARAPRVQLLMLRILCEQGRAVAPPGLLERLFPHETERRASLRSARAALPRDPFCHIVQFWRSDRDSRY